MDTAPPLAQAALVHPASTSTSPPTPSATPSATSQASLAHWSEAGRRGMEAFYALATEDYRQLAAARDWAGTFRDLAAGRDRITLLDVACGSGKFPTALLATPDVAALAGELVVQTDLLDPSRFSLDEARGTLAPPFEGAADHECTLQDLEVRPGGWDLVWSTHGLYALAPDEVAAGMARFVEAMAPDGLGVVAQATTASHYLVVDDAFRRSFDPDGVRVPYTSAEQVVAALADLPVTVDQQLLTYRTSVARDDRGTAEGFLQRCVFDDSVSLEAMEADPVLGAYLDSCVEGDRWVFDHQVALITVRRAEVSA